MLVPVNQFRTPALESGIVAWKEIIYVQIAAIQDEHKLDADPELDLAILAWEEIISVQISDIQDQHKLDADSAPATISKKSNFLLARFEYSKTVIRLQISEINLTQKSKAIKQIK